MDLMTLAAKITLDAGAYEKGLKNAEKGMDKFGKALSAKTVALGTFAGNMLTKATTASLKAVSNVIRSATKAYSDFEQLTGGVKTLFGTREISNAKDYAKQIGLISQKVDKAGKTITTVNKKMAKTLFGDPTGKTVSKMSADEAANRIYAQAEQAQKNVMSNAGKAYMTAGVSMNHYMETATAFAASMNQATGGDTIKSAALTDQAIRDMADNANKMGTDMGAVENAYKGFAKGNYTMLDNLKLGYGGTKTEMARLLKDASKLTGQKYKMGNMADIVEAIHAIQENQGITGTTKKEARETIEGSKNMLKASWENVLTALAAPEDLDLSGAIASLTDSAKTYLNNLFPVVSKIMDGLGTFMEEVLPDVMEKLPEMIADFAPKLVKAGKKMFEGFGRGLKKVFNKIPWPTWDDVKNFASNAWKTVVKGVEGLGGLVFGKAEDGTVAWPDVNKLVADFGVWWSETALPALKGAMVWTLTLFGMPTEDAESIAELVGNWWNTIVETVQGVIKWVLNLPDTPHEAGEQLGEIIGKWWEGVKSYAEGVLKWTLGLFGIGDSEGTQTNKMIQDWWNEKVVPFLGSVLNFVLGLFGLPDASAMVTSITTWWEEVKTLLGEGLSLAIKVLLPEWAQNLLFGGKTGNDDLPETKTPGNNASENDLDNYTIAIVDPPSKPKRRGVDPHKAIDAAAEAAKKAENAEGNYNATLDKTGEVSEKSTKRVTDGMDKSKKSIDAAGEGLAAFAEGLAGLKDKTITITTIYRTIGSYIGAGKIYNPNSANVKKIPGSGTPVIEGKYDAKGDWSVPYDDYLTRLHRGEMVLTKSQARQYREGGNSGNIDIEGLAASIVGAVKEGMANATVNSYLDGKGVTKRVNRRNDNRDKARRFVTA